MTLFVGFEFFLVPFLLLVVFIVSDRLNVEEHIKSLLLHQIFRKLPYEHVKIVERKKYIYI